MDGEQSIAVLEALLADKGEDLLRTAILLAGGRAEGEDLLQSALERVIKRWRWIRGDPEGYLRRTLHHLAINGWRAKLAWRARLGLLAAPAAAPDMADAVDQRTGSSGCCGNCRRGSAPRWCSGTGRTLPRRRPPRR
jgi:DNA-directed RNA polymerase specialized sigma24 family protein